jgi:hypothetical protein
MNNRKTDTKQNRLRDGYSILRVTSRYITMLKRLISEPVVCLTPNDQMLTYIMARICYIHHGENMLHSS